MPHRLTGTSGSAIRFYYDAHAAGKPAAPGGSPADAPGHYAAHEAIDVLVADIQGFFAGLTAG